jgi:hypothetical protein
MGGHGGSKGIGGKITTGLGGLIQQQISGSKFSPKEIKISKNIYAKIDMTLKGDQLIISKIDRSRGSEFAPTLVGTRGFSLSDPNAIANAEKYIKSK